MILEAAIINLTRNLDILSQKGGQGISSHDNLKEEGLNCLSSLLNNAPKQEYKKLFNSEDHEILLGYLVNVLCQLVKNDSSKLLKLKALNILLSLVEHLETHHDILRSDGKCSINLVRSALPGVSSTLFKLIMSDTKLPRNLLIVAIKVLNKFIMIALKNCEHKALLLHGDVLKDTCDNLAIRLTFMIDYVINHCADLHNEVKYEMFDLCQSIVTGTNTELVGRTIESIIKYIAFISSANQVPDSLIHEVQLRIMLITDNIKEMIQNCDNDCDRLDSLVISCLIKQLDNLESHYSSMLPGERESQLLIFEGFLKLLPSDSLTIFLETLERRHQLMKVLTLLAEFSNQQPFLFLTESHIDDKALESCYERIYTVEKRFAHITDAENRILVSCCRIIGTNLDWPLISDIIKTESSQCSSPSHLYIIHLLIKGLMDRTDKDSKFFRLSKLMILHYVEHTHDQYLALNQILMQQESLLSQNILKVVIAIEILVTLLELHVKSNPSEHDRVVILKPLLCPLLNWASSSCRAISEAALSALARTSLLYEVGSTKGLIEANLDYIIDGVGQMLDNLIQNPELTNVLAMTFKLSSIESFYYFRDIYEKIFKFLGIYHHTEKSKSIALLFYRTLSILSEWKKAKDEFNCTKDGDNPLESDSIVKTIVRDLDIELRLTKLQDDMESDDRLKRRLEEIQTTEVDQAKIMEEIKRGEMPSEIIDNDEKHDTGDEKVEEKKDKAPDIVLAEKILNHCINLISSNHNETKILALRAAACGFKILQDDEDTLLPLVHKLWAPLVSRLTSDYRQNLEINLCAFECLVSMAVCAKDFIKLRTLDSIIPRLCLFLESQASQSKGQKEYGPYCMTMAYKCQLRILTHLGKLAYHIQLAYTSLWRIVKTTLIYLDDKQVNSLRLAAQNSLHYLIALDSDCVWYYFKKSGQSNDLPFELIYEAIK